MKLSCFIGLLLLWYQSLQVSCTSMDVVAAENYKRLTGCLRYKRHYDLKFPSDAQEHYNNLLSTTAQYRNHTPHRGGNYTGPWIENYFIEAFLSKPLDYFGGLFPLFVQWSDYQLKMRSPDLTDAAMFDELIRLLRPNVLYLAVSQANHGLYFLKKSHPNVIEMSAGGDGNIPIPLVKGNLPYYAIAPEYPMIDVGFYGSPNHGPRQYILAEMKQHLSKTQVRLRIGPSNRWTMDMSLTSFNLAPRGFGRASFRLAEIIQLGRIPVYLYDDYPWIPYAGSAVSVTELGLMGHLGNLHTTVTTMLKMTNETKYDLLQKVRLARKYYTYEGVLEQISLFLNDPLGPKGGYLRCYIIPSSEHTVLDINL